MWNDLAKRLTDVLRRIAWRQIDDPEFKARVITRVNEKINLPLLSEEDERELLEVVWQAIRQAIEEVAKEPETPPAT